MISAPKTVLVVDDEPSVRWLLQHGLPPLLPGFDVATVANGSEARDYLTSHPVDVLVTDIVMPVMDGFELLAHVRNSHPNLPVVVLASMAPRRVTEHAPTLGAMHVLQKPASPETVAHHILEARSETVRGRMAGVPLPTLLQLMRLERKTCSLLVRSGEHKGRLHFLSGELVNAYAFGSNTEGEEAARFLLGLDAVTIDFERSLHNHVRQIHTPLETLLLTLAKESDELRAVVPAADEVRATRPLAQALDRSATPSQPATAASPSEPPTTASPHPARHTAEPAALDRSADGLQVALGQLRERTRSTAGLLDAAAPHLAAAARSLATARREAGPSDRRDHRIALACAEVAALANRLARAADDLAGTVARRG